jgi:hypothetical protein
MCRDFVAGNNDTIAKAAYYRMLSEVWFNTARLGEIREQNEGWEIMDIVSKELRSFEAK